MHSSPSLPEGLVIPDHHLERRIGQGGYGEIWLARNVIGTYRAIKIVYRSHFDNPKPYEREFAGLKAFEPLSRNHPGLVDVLQVGRNDDAGYIYYVMELADDEVSGRIVDPDTYSAKTLARERDRLGRLPADECLAIGRNLASALSFLHKAGLVHRDVKPANIIFVNGEPKLADIGLVVSLSEARTYVGSDGYIPPEGPGTVQADIYSVGKVLYEISTGQHREQFPELPQDIAKFEDSPVILELNEVVTKACDHERDRRYETAEDLRADLEMILSGRSVKQLRFIERQLLRVRRAARVATVLAVIAAIFAGVVLFMGHQKNQLLAGAYVTSGVQLVESADAHAAIPLFAAALQLQAGNEAAEDAHRMRIGLALAESPRLLQFWNHTSAVHEIRFSLDGERVLMAGGRLARLMDIKSGESRRDYPTRHRINGAVLSPDNTRLAVANGSYLTVFDAVTGEEIYDRRGRAGVSSVEYSPDGQQIVMGCACSRATLVDAQTGATMAEFVGHSNEVSYAAFSPDGRRIVTAGRDGTARLWDAHTYELKAVLRHPGGVWVVHAAFSPDGQRVAAAISDNTLFIWNVSGEPYVSARMEHQGTIQRANFSPDGRWLAAASMDNTVRIWETATAKPGLPMIHLHAPALRSVFSPEGRRLAISGFDGRVSVWDVAGNVPRNVGPGIVSANGERYISFTSNSFRIWNARDDSPVTPQIPVSISFSQGACSADARIVAFYGPGPERTGTVFVYETTSGRARTFPINDARQSIALSPDGSKVVSTNGSVAVVWDTSSGQKIYERRDLAGRVDRVAFSPDNRLLALSSTGSVFVIEMDSWTERFAPITNSMRVIWMAFSQDSTRLAGATYTTSFDPGAAFICDARTGQRLAEFKGHSDGLRSAMLTRDHETLVTAGEDSRVFVWDAATSEQRLEPRALPQPIQAVNLSTDDRWLMACSWHFVQLWELKTGRAVTSSLRVPIGVLDQLGLTADKDRLWARSSRGLFFWDLPRAPEEPETLFALAHHLGVMIPVGLDWSADALPLSKLRARCAEEQARVAATLEAWHLHHVRRSEFRQDWFAAHFHLDQLLKREPGNLELRARARTAREHLEKTLSAAAGTPATIAP